jgi:hypothetical protein
MLVRQGIRIILLFHQCANTIDIGNYSKNDLLSPHMRRFTLESNRTIP